jgi:hypothetical protein
VTNPLFGTLSWISSPGAQKYFSILSGTLVNGIESQGMVYDRQERIFCQQLLLAAEGAGFDLDVGNVALNEIAIHLDAHLEANGSKSLIHGPLGLALEIQVSKE